VSPVRRFAVPAAADRRRIARRRRVAVRRRFAVGRLGFTLVELLLVLVVLATLAALTVPAALRLFDDYALRESAEAIRGDLERARIDAVETGVIYEFRAEAGGDRWVVVPAERETATVAGVQSTEWVPVRGGTLAEGVTFPSTSALVPTAARPTAEYFEGLPNAPELGQAQWSAPIRFSPDGTAAAASVTIAAEDGRTVTVSVRALTGAPTIEPVQAEPQL